MARTLTGRLWRLARWPLLVLAVAFAAIQLVPYGWWHENPAVGHDAPWPDAESERIARQSCYSCHSNETDWPAYSYIAPMSWLVRSDVERGREELNFSDWGEFSDGADDAVEVVREGEMPPGRYTLIHRGASLASTERDTLVQALIAMGGDDD